MLLILLAAVKSLSHVRLFAAPWTIAYQASPPVGFSRQEYWRGLPFPSPGDLPDPGIEPGSPTLQADTLPSEPPGKSSLSPVIHKKFQNKLYQCHSNSNINFVKPTIPLPCFLSLTLSSFSLRKYSQCCVKNVS